MTTSSKDQKTRDIELLGQDSALRQLFDALTPPDGSAGNLDLASQLAPHAWVEIENLPDQAKAREREEFEKRNEGRQIIPEGCQEAYELVQDAARLAKRSNQMSPDWWINFCKWAWDEAVTD